MPPVSRHCYVPTSPAIPAASPQFVAGSFYATPLADTPCADPSLVHQYPAYLRPNIWPEDHLPELKPAIKAVAKIMIDTGLLLMDSCDR